jgi:DNA-directed RNA polymerase specialized sigma24 family protein
VDRDLVEKAQRGDRDAFGVLARSRADQLFAIGQRILRDVGRAEDAMQQALVIAWRELPRLRDPDRFDAWLTRLLVNACYAEARRRREWSANIRVLPVDGPAVADATQGIVDETSSSAAFGACRRTSARSSSCITTSG